VRGAEVGRHRERVVEVGKRRFGIARAGVEDGLCCLLDPCLLLWG
jgi:hypothetical protein